MKKVTAIYVRRSVSDKDKGNNSLSIDSQIADCKKSLQDGEEFRVYCDDGKSGKNTKRPAFEQMMEDAREGLIGRIVVKKYDRFSRNIRDYLNITNELDGYSVSVSSLTEQYNTSTKEGRVMRNTLLSFAEFERESIAARVMDAYNTRAAETGFYQGGKVYYGYVPERRTINGKTGSVLVPSERAEAVRVAYQVYKEVNTSLQDVIEFYKENGVDTSFISKKSGKEKNMERSYVSKLLKSPLYVRADIEVYQYLKSKGFEIIDDVDAFDGVHGLFRHKREDGKEYIKVGYHEGIIDSDTWLTVQDKKAHNKKIPNNSGAKKSWLVGLTKCPHCGYGFYIFYSWNASKTKQWRYYGDRGVFTIKSCVSNKRLRLKPDEVEKIVYNAMKERIASLEIARTKEETPDIETDKMKKEVVHLDNEINGLLEKVLIADGAMFNLLQKRVNELYAMKTEIEENLRARARKKKDIDIVPLKDPLSRWEELTVEEKNQLAKSMIEVVYLSDYAEEKVSISNFAH